MKYFELKDSLFDITEKYPQTLAVFINNGFTQLADESKRTTFGKALQLDIAVMMRQLDQHNFIEALETAITRSLPEKRDTETVYVKGLLPCPVRLPLQEFLDEMIAEKALEGVKIVADLKAASMGLDWMKDEVATVTSVDQLDDIYISAGFDMFFDQEYFGRFIKSGEFSDPIHWNSINKDFDNEMISLKDPLGRYGIIAVVSAVFLVNTEVLAGRPVPQSWLELLDPVYEQSVSLPVADFDLFNAILLTIDNNYGRDAVKALGRNMLTSLHPAQMVKSDRLKMNKPAITIMPYFFTKMVKEGSVMKAVWPKDGAIISPIFMIGKNSDNRHIAEIAEVISGAKVAEILSHQGLFPSLHPTIDNRLPDGATFLWLGWDYIEAHDLNSKFAECQQAFNESQLVEKIEI
jgi:ABC-type Fe3+ transport system substrate-binding protein